MAKKNSASTAKNAGTVATEEFELPDDYQPDPDDWTGGQPTKKAKHFWPSAKRLMGLLAPEKWWFTFVVVLVVASVVLTVIAPKVLGQAMDVIFNGIIGKQLPKGVPLDQVIAGARAQGNDQFADMLAGAKVVPGEGIDFGLLSRLILTVLALYLVASFLMWWNGYILNRLVMRVVYRLREDIEAKINLLPLSYFDGRQRGDVLSRVTNDVDTIGQTLQNSLTSLVSAVTMFIGSVVMMLSTNWVMALTAIVSSMLGFGLMLGIMSRSQKYFVARQRWLGDLNGHIEEIYTGHNVVRLFGAEQREQQAFDRINSKMQETDWKSQFMSGLMMPLMGFIGNFAYVAVCVVGAVLAMNGTISFGVIVAFMMYVRLFTSPLSQLAQAATNLQSAAAAAERVFEFLEAKEMPDESHLPAQTKTVRGEVAFDHVRFGYTPDKIIIHDFSEHVQPGQKVAIVGPTGAGKTTMVNLLMKFYPLGGGEIRIDGVPLSQMTREHVHDLFGMVLQDTWLFEGSIRDNLCYGKEGITDEQLDQVTRATGLYHLIHTLPEGYDTLLSDKLNLSAGQKQLMTIARAMIENAPMLILDEATSSVDTRTEMLIQQAMDTLTKGRTSFVIAHRLSTIKNADKILVMRHGDIIESGTHEELLQKGGFYAELYNSQFEQA